MWARVWLTLAAVETERLAPQGREAREKEKEMPKTGVVADVVEGISVEVETLVPREGVRQLTAEQIGDAPQFREDCSALRTLRIVQHCHWLTHSSVILATRYISSDRTIVAWTVEERMNKYHFQDTFENEKILIKTVLAGDQLCVCRSICQWHDTEQLVLTPRGAEDGGLIDLEHEQLTLIAQQLRKMPKARGDSMVKLSANRETLIHMASEQA